MAIFFIPLVALWLIFTGRLILESAWFRILGGVLLVVFFLEIFETAAILNLLVGIVAVLVLIVGILSGLLSSRAGTTTAITKPEKRTK